MKLLDQYIQIHKEKEYGNTGHNWVDHFDTTNVNSILDYGCGRSTLLDIVNVEVKHRYDPAIEEFSKKPEGLEFDLVVCTDVLEHIPEDELDELLCEICRYGNKAFFSISMSLAQQILPNGMNAHVTVRNYDWWKELLSKYFTDLDIRTFSTSYTLAEGKCKKNTDQ